MIEKKDLWPNYIAQEVSFVILLFLNNSLSPTLLVSGIGGRANFKPFGRKFSSMFDDWNDEWFVITLSGWGDFNNTYLFNNIVTI